MNYNDSTDTSVAAAIARLAGLVVSIAMVVGGFAFSIYLAHLVFG